MLEAVFVAMALLLLLLAGVAPNLFLRPLPKRQGKEKREPERQKPAADDVALLRFPSRPVWPDDQALETKPR
jgi:hypothetical protein